MSRTYALRTRTDAVHRGTLDALNLRGAALVTPTGHVYVEAADVADLYPTDNASAAVILPWERVSPEGSLTGQPSTR